MQNTEYCRYCGREIEADSKFCKYCGKDLHKPSSPNILVGKGTQLYLFFMDLKNKFKISKILKTSINNDIGKRIFKFISFGILGIIIIGTMVWGLYYYFEEIRPKQTGKEILQNEKNQLLTLQHNELYYKCNDIISNHNIPKCGIYNLDMNNRSELTNIAWGKIQELAENGNSNAQYILAKKYLGYDFWNGEWYREAYKKDGRFINKDIDRDKAAYWGLQAAMQGHDSAQNFIGRCYENGLGVDKNIRYAIYWYRKSAEKGNDMGQLNLGDCFRDGHKIRTGEHWEKDKTAIYYDWQSKFGYHLVNEYEVLITQDLDSAFYYWHKSAEQGNKEAKKRLQKIY